MLNQDAGRSDLVEIARLNGDFRKNYGKMLGAFLYLRSLRAVRGQALIWSSGLLAAVAAAFTWLQRHGWPSLPF
jgi:hypothetical protein